MMAVPRLTAVLALLVGVSTAFFQQFMGGGQTIQFEMSGDGGGMFQQIFGGGGPKRTPNTDMSITVPLEDMYKGRDLPLQLQRQAVCDQCHGTGAETQKKCPHCKGRGVMRHPIHPIQQHCHHCEGSGKIADKKCPKCNGRKVERQTVERTVRLPPGTPEGYEIVLEKLADESPGVEPGEVVLHIKSSEHSTFKRDGDKLSAEVTISLGQALLGFKRTLTHLDGHTVDVSREGVTQHETVSRIDGEGMPIFRDEKSEKRRNQKAQAGQLEVTYRVRHPVGLTTSQKEILFAAFPEQAEVVQGMLEMLDEESSGDDEEEH